MIDVLKKNNGAHGRYPCPKINNVLLFLKSISVKSQQANALPRMRSCASSFVRETSGADNSVSQPYFLTKSTSLYGLIATLMLRYQSFKLDIS